MKPTETVKLVAVVKALCPAQAIDQFTPDAWHEVLAPCDLEDCLRAVRELAGRQPYISVSDIATVVRETRRVNASKHRDRVPLADPDDVAAYRAELVRNRRAAGSSTPTRELTQ